MIKQLSNSITSFLVQENIIEYSEAEIYSYGTEQIIINLSVFIIIGLGATMFGVWPSTIFFFTGFMPLRLVAGGYHAKTPQKCNILSLLMIL